MVSAPTAGAERRRPSPHGPVSRMSRAKIGNSAVGAAEKHREHVERQCAEDHAIVPHEAEAAEQRARLNGSLERGARSMRISASMTRADAPQRDGDAIDRCRARADRASRRAPARRSGRSGWRRRTRRSPRGTSGARHQRGNDRRHGRDFEGARGADHRDDDVDRSRVPSDRSRCRAPGSRRRSASTIWHSIRISDGRSGRRRGRRTAVNTSIGTNWARPRRPRSKALPVSS